MELLGEVMLLNLAPEPPPLRLEPDGTARVGPSRITLDILLDEFRAGVDLVARFPSLAPADIYGAVAYALRHPAEVDEYLARREAEAAELRRVIEARQGPQPSREELVARWHARRGT